MDGIGQMAAVAGVLVLLLATIWWLKRRGMAELHLAKRPGGCRLERVARLPLGPQQTLHLVRLGETAFLVASAPGGCALVATVPYRDISEPGKAAE